MILDSLLLLYTKRIGIPFKIRLLNTLSRIIKHDIKGFVFTSWETIWEEALSISKRCNKIEAIGNEKMNVNLLTALITFLHHGRNYLSAGDAMTVLANAMKVLQDLRPVTCFEGIILLVNCLPTAFPQYDEYLPQWLLIWTRISGNVYWDCYWLTLFTRARKYTTTFNWQEIGPLLLSKTRELLQLPTKGKAPQKTFFPFSIPNYYTRLVVLDLDVHKAAVEKISKLIYFVGMQGEKVFANPIPITPPRLPDGHVMPAILGLNQGCEVHSGMVNISLFLQSIRVYFHPSNYGVWTANLLILSSVLIKQVCRSVARSLASKHITSMRPIDLQIFDSHPLDMKSLQYLCGALLPLIFEGLYGKNPMLIPVSVGSIKNLAALDSSLADVIIPFLLSALDPKAVNLSHQAPAAMTTLCLCLRSFLYPRPVVIPYLSEILRLSLDGIDPNDTWKSMSAFNLYGSIFSWIPIGSSLRQMKGSTASSYLSSACGSDASNNVVVDYSQDLDLLAEYTSEWSLAFIDKLVALLEAKELKQKGKKGNKDLAALISSTFECVFVAASADVRYNVCHKIMEYLKSQASTNAAKEWAMILDVVASTEPSKNKLWFSVCHFKFVYHLELLLTIHDHLLDADMIGLGCSQDKLALRLRLLGGAVRRCDERSDEHHGICRAIWKFAHQDLLVHHTEKNIRKLVSKLKKDLIRGKASIYALPKSPAVQTVLGIPNDVSSAQVNWHIPSEESVSFAVGVMKSTIGESIVSIMSSLENFDSTFKGVEDRTLSLKKLEERIITWLHMIFKSIRGACELMSDDVFIGDRASKLLTTGHKLLDDLSPPIREYLLMLRPTLFQFLLDFQTKLRHFSECNEDLANLVINADIQKVNNDYLVLCFDRHLVVDEDIFFDGNYPRFE